MPSQTDKLETKRHPTGDGLFIGKPSRLVLENGEEFFGFAPQWQSGTYSGEVVFTTGMSGYVESLTDPSYAGQILTFTYPLIGNYGVPDREVWESPKIQVRGVVLSEACTDWSHHAGTTSLLSWLYEHRVPAVMGVDTRAVTKTLREHGTMLGGIASLATEAPSEFPKYPKDIVRHVSSNHKEIVNPGHPKRVIVVDCGVKQNSLRTLMQHPVTVERVPYDYDYSEQSFDGVFLSNGPGDPAACVATVAILRKVMRRKKPIFGICLGSQLLALAAGATTYKLPYGHRGHNQPCLDIADGHCVITSQNHGYAVDEASLPANWQVRFRNLNDGSVEGITHTSQPWFGVQFHPEAAPGPTDTANLFDTFLTSL